MTLQKNYHFINWAKNVSINIPYYYQPQKLEELSQIINNHSKIGMAGQRHSWNHLWKDTEALVDLSYLSTEPMINPDTLEVEIPAGMKLWQINQFLDKHQLAFQNLGSIDQQSIAGAISTGTHGTGINFGCLATQCTAFTFMDGSGNLHSLTQNDKNFYGSLISLGTLGIFIKLKLQVVPAYQIQENTFTCNWQNAIEQLENWLIEYDHLKFWWLPPSTEVMVYGMKRTQNPVQESKFQHFWREKVLSVWFYRLFVKIGNGFPSLRPKINQFLTAQMRKPYQRTNKSYKIFKVPQPPKHRETEWAFPLSDHKKILAHYFKKYSDNRFTFNFIQEIRVTKADSFWLSPCFERDTLWLGIYNHHDPQWNDLLKDFQSFAIEHQGRPHWGKEFFYPSLNFHQLYPKLKDFLELKKLYDPENKFINHGILL